MARLSALGSRQILGALTMRSRFFRTQFFLLYAAVTMVVPLGIKSQAAPASPIACNSISDAATLANCIVWWCGGQMCNPSQYQYLIDMIRPALRNQGEDYRLIMDKWSTVSMNATVGNSPSSIIGTVAYQLANFQNQLRPMVSTAAQAANNLATATKPMIPALMAGAAAAGGAAATVGNAVGGVAGSVGSAVVGAGAATVVAGGVAVVGGAAVVTLTGMLAYESVRWRYAAVESERLEVEACQAIARTNLSLYNHFLDPENGSPTRGQCQSYYEFNTRCRRHIESSIPVILSQSCMST